MFLSIVYIIGGLAALILLVALFIKKEYTLVSEVVVNKPKDEVFNYIIHLKNQQYYNKWIMADPNVKMTYQGVDGTIGFVSAWESKDAGKGEQEIKSITDKQGCSVELRFEKPFKGISYQNVLVEAISVSQTKVRTTFDTHTAFPMSAMIPLLKIILKKDMNINAQNLKRVLEANRQ